MKTAVITGGLGFIGSNLIRALMRNNYFIINIDKVSYASNFKNIPSNIKNYKFYKLDINQQDKFKNILIKYHPDKIFNLAAETHVDRSIDNPPASAVSAVVPCPPSGPVPPPAAGSSSPPPGPTPPPGLPPTL